LENITISAGTQVRWTNNHVTHTVTSGTPGSPSGVFNSGNLPNGSSYQFTFSNAGSFPYYCDIHQSMTATVTVNS